MGTNLQQSQFTKCANDSHAKGYIVCKTTDGKYQVRAQVHHNNKQNFYDLNNVNVTDLSNHSTHQTSYQDYTHSGDQPDLFVAQQ